MSWRKRLKSRNVIRALLAAGLLLGGGSVAYVAPGTELLCSLVGCV